MKDREGYLISILEDLKKVIIFEDKNFTINKSYGKICLEINYVDGKYNCDITKVMSNKRF